ncbi:hypothetical protein M501DRAFT_914715, partial [Patellaria atrata CBS 101060]
MFGFIADLITSVISILFPVFASYKALEHGDPAELTPWLMYWVIFSLAHLFEYNLGFIIDWLPFYSWLRLFVYMYLVMPGSQGAPYLYQAYVHPFLEHHEKEIDEFIGDAHEKAKAAGLSYMHKAIEWVKVNALGLPPSRPSPPLNRQTTYAQSLMSRFSIPSARAGSVGAASDIYSLLSQVVASAAAGPASTREPQVGGLNRSNTLIPDNIRDNDERLNYVSNTRERLRTLLQAYDREAYNLASDDGYYERTRESRGSRDVSGDMRSSGLAKSRSELEFDTIDPSEVGERRPTPPLTVPIPNKDGQAGWMPWNW